MFSHLGQSETFRNFQDGYLERAQGPCQKEPHGHLGRHRRNRRLRLAHRHHRRRRRSLEVGCENFDFFAEMGD